MVSGVAVRRKCIRRISTGVTWAVAPQSVSFSPCQHDLICVKWGVLGQ